MEGPCGVSDVNATHCELSQGRRSDFYYYDTRAAPPPTLAAFPQAATDFFNDGRLALVRTYTDACGGEFLDTKYGSYTAEGLPEKVITPDGVVEESASTGMLTTRVSGRDPSKQTGLVLAWDRGNLQKVTYPNGDSWRACYAARNFATIPPQEQVLNFPDCPKVASPGYSTPTGSSGSGGSGNGGGASGTVGYGGHRGQGNGNGGVGNGVGIGNQLLGGRFDTMGKPLWIGRFSADGRPREHYSLQYSADRTLARVEFFDEPELIDGAYSFYPTKAQGQFRVKPVWSRTMVTDSDRKLVASVLADKVPTVLARDVRGDVAAFGSGFDFANPTMPAAASLSCLGTDSAFCKQLRYDRLGRLSSLSRPSVGTVGSDCLTYDPQGNLSSYSRGCAPVACAATAPTGVVVGADGSLTVTGAPTCSGSPISYVHDDFGSLVSITQKNGPNRSETRLTYDARGELLATSTAEQRSRPGFSGMFRSADAIGRTIAIAEWPPAHGPNLVYNIYDQFDPPVECQTRFGTPAFTKGRLAFQQTPLWNIWYGYDAMGQVVSELKLARSLSDCPAQESDKMNFTAYSYGYRGRLEEIRYPLGRHVRYQFPPTGAEAGRDPERPIGIDVEVFRAGGSTYVPMVTDISWSRDGLLLGYRALTLDS